MTDLGGGGYDGDGGAGMTEMGAAGVTGKWGAGAAVGVVMVFSLSVLS